MNDYNSLPSSPSTDSSEATAPLNPAPTVPSTTPLPTVPPPPTDGSSAPSPPMSAPSPVASPPVASPPVTPPRPVPQPVPAGTTTPYGGIAAPPPSGPNMVVASPPPPQPVPSAPPYMPSPPTAPPPNVAPQSVMTQPQGIAPAVPATPAPGGALPRPATPSQEIVAGATLPVQQLAQAVRREVSKAVVGQDAIITQFLIALMVRGHVLLEGVPGVAKTLTSRAVAKALSAEFKRIQFTPDLMPSDVVGTNIFDSRSNDFTLRKGPVFTDLLLADEINRTPPKTQASLLEAMQERHVTIDGENYPLSPLFTVLATQNPVDYEGTYPLPEAQLDRFLMKVEMGYPSPEEEAALLVRVHRGFDAHELTGVNPVAGLADLQAAREAVRRVTVSEGMIRYVTNIVGRTRGLPTLTLGGSPRASIALLECAKAYAAMTGRDYVVPEDVKTMAPPVLRHRLLLRAESEMDGLRPDDVVNAVVGAVEVPR